MMTPATYSELEATYDRLYELGDYTPAQRARLAVVLNAMVEVHACDYLEGDLTEYRRRAQAGARYLAARGLGLEPSPAELQELAEY